VSDVSLLFFVILYVNGSEKGFTSYSEPYNALKRAGVNFSYSRYRKIVSLAEDYGLLKTIPFGEWVRTSSSFSMGRRGNIPNKCVLLTEKGEKLVNRLEELRRIGLDAPVREAEVLLHLATSIKRT